MKRIVQKLFGVRKAVQYKSDDHYITLFKLKKKVVVHLDGKQVFNNLKSNEEFSQWWNNFRKDHKLKKLTKSDSFLLYKDLIKRKMNELKGN